MKEGDIPIVGDGNTLGSLLPYESPAKWLDEGGIIWECYLEDDFC